jgi:hypothetical protein
MAALSRATVPGRFERTIGSEAGALAHFIVGCFLVRRNGVPR